MSAEVSVTANVHTYPTGAVIVQEGPEAPREMFVVLQGNVGVFRNFGLNTQQQMGVISKGSFHGELSLFLNREQEQTLVALTEVVLLHVNRRTVKGFLSGQPDLAISIVEGICGRLEEATKRLEQLDSGGEQKASGSSSLFPEQHGSYTLPLQNDSEYLYVAKTNCPMCGHRFDNIGVIKSKLRLLRTDPDMRMRYKDIEPMYYDITTCPNCFYSTPADRFEEPSPRLASAVNQRVGPYKLEIAIQTGKQRDTFAVFAGYYLAILCAPAVFDGYHTVTGGLWLRLSRLYSDLGEPELYLFAAQKALDDYLYAYQNLDIVGRQLQQITYLIGDLYMRCGDIDAGRNFFFMLKTDKATPKALRRQTDIRLEEIREIILAEKERLERESEAMA